ncbi:glycosyltransferase, partial [Flavobacterium sp.]|uniref:glycosyltransferase n=1 Tax=Flavobacterium sp. TaxID=239 RepID=UPI0037BE431F
MKEVASNILFCYQNGFFPQNGGVQRYCHSLGEFLEEKGFNVYYLSLKFDKDFQLLKPNNYFVLPNSEVLYHKENKFFYKSLLEKLKIHTVINNEATNNRFSFFIPSKEVEVTHIAIFHQDPVFNLNFSGENTLFKKIIDHLRIIKRKRALEFLLKNSDQLVVLSSKYVQKLNENLKIHSNKLVAISNFTHFQKLDIGLVQKTDTVLYVGRLEQVKQVDLLINVWKLIEDKTVGWNLVIIGEGPQSEYLKNLASEIGVKAIKFTGKIDPTTYYKSAKIICLPSKYEGFGLVLVEAMAYGVVPIAFNNWLSLSEIITNEVDGYIVDDKNMMGLFTVIDSLIKNDNKLVEMSEKARESAKKFD